MNTLDEVMASIPTLNSWGFTKPSWWNQADLAEDRTELLGHEDRIMLTVTWLQDNLPRSSTPNRTSRWLRSLVEGQEGTYFLTHGEFIAAGILAGYVWEHSKGFNVRFGVEGLDRLIASNNPTRSGMIL